MRGFLTTFAKSVFIVWVVANDEHLWTFQIISVTDGGRPVHVRRARWFQSRGSCFSSARSFGKRAGYLYPALSNISLGVRLSRSLLLPSQVKIGRRRSAGAVGHALKDHLEAAFAEGIPTRRAKTSRGRRMTLKGEKSGGGGV